MLFSDGMADRDPELFVKLCDLLGAGFCFSKVEDYQLALEWAERAYKLGQREIKESPCPTP